MILDHYQNHVRKSIHTKAKPKQTKATTKAYYVVCLCVRTPFPFSCVCVCFSKKKKKVSLFIKTGTINYVSLSSPKHNIG